MASQDEVRLIIKAVADQAIGELKKLDAQMGKQVDSTSKLTKGVGGLRTAWLASAGALYAAGRAINTMIKDASNLEEAQNKWLVVFDDTTESLGIATQAIAELTENYAMSRREALQYTSELGNLLKAMGQTPEAAALMSTEMTKLAADLASFNNIATDEALIALRAALVGETEPMRRLGVDVSQVTLQMEAMKLGIEGNVAQMDRSTKMMLTYNAIMRQTTDAQGDMIRTADSYANVSKRMDASLEDASATLGQRLKPLATGGKKVLIGLIEGVSGGLKLWEHSINNLAYYWLYLQGITQKVFLNIKLFAIEAAKNISDPIIEGLNVVIRGLNKLPKVHIEEMQKMTEASVQYVEDELRLNELKLEALTEYHELRREEIENDNVAKEELEQTHNLNLEEIQKAHIQKIKKEQQKAVKFANQLDKDWLKNRIENRGLDTANYMTWSNFMMSSMDKNSRWQFALWKAFAIQQAIINTHQAAVAGYNAMAGIPVVGPALGAAAAAAAIAFGMMQVKRIASADFKGAEEGALIRGVPGATGTLIRAGENNKDEAIIPLEDSDVMGRMGGITVNFNVDTMVAGDDFPRETAIRIDNALYKLKREGLSKL